MMCENELCDDAVDFQTRIDIGSETDETGQDRTTGGVSCPLGPRNIDTYSPRAGVTTRCKIALVVILIVIVIVILFVVVIVGILPYLIYLLSKTHTEEGKSAQAGPHNDTLILLQESITKKTTEVFRYQCHREYNHFDVTNSNTVSYNGLSPPALVFKYGGLYNITLSVVYDEDYCRHSPPKGTIHLGIERAGDHSQVGTAFSESFSRRKGRKWVKYGLISTKVRMQPEEGLLISTDFRDCINGHKTYFSVTTLR